MGPAGSDAKGRAVGLRWPTHGTAPRRGAAGSWACREFRMSLHGQNSRADESAWIRSQPLKNIAVGRRASGLLAKRLGADGGARQLPVLRPAACQYRVLGPMVGPANCRVRAGGKVLRCRRRSQTPRGATSWWFKLRCQILWCGGTAGGKCGRSHLAVGPTPDSKFHGRIPKRLQLVISDIFTTRPKRKLEKLTQEWRRAMRSDIAAAGVTQPPPGVPQFL